MGDDLDVEEACRFLKVGLQCTQAVLRGRPKMTNIVNMLVGEEGVTMEKVIKPEPLSMVIKLEQLSTEE
jgi:hypothetical protein